MKRIAIVGGGASGTLVAVNLARNATADNPVQINLIDEQRFIGRGVAYSSTQPFHLLNVPAGKISAFPDIPDDFLKWLHEKGIPANETSFLPRGLYGDYLADLFNRELKSAEFAEIHTYHDRACDLIMDDRLSLLLESGRTVQSDYLVLAFGNFPPPHPSVPDRSFTKSPRYIRNIWRKEAFGQIRPIDTVLILGTGLSMVDAVLSLKSAGHSGKIYATSTRGLLPAIHAPAGPCLDLPKELIDARTLRKVVELVRREMHRAVSDGSNWRDVIDALRPHTQAIWQRLSEKEKRRFVVHLSRWWNVARHRMPQSAASEIDKLIQAGHLQIVSGRVTDIRNCGDRFEVAISRCGTVINLCPDVVINCIAGESRYRRVESKFLGKLFGRGYVREGPLGFGFDALPNGAILDKNGVCGGRLFTLGTAMKGVLWETTAIPEIRSQAAALSRCLLSPPKH